VWIFHEAGPSAILGGEARLVPGRDVVVEGVTALVRDGAKWVLARRVAAAEAPALAQRLRAAMQPPAAEEQAPLDLAGLGLGVPSADQAGANASGQTEDARTLWVDWDAHGERFKPWRDVCRESSNEDLDENRVDGPVTALHMSKAMERQGGDPRSWLERWRREKKLESNDRVAHELRTLTDVLFLNGSVDQLNVGGLHGVEVLCRRIAAIVEAHAAAGRPTWEHAKYYAGTAAAEEVVAPALRSQVLRRAREEAELSTARSRGVPRGAGKADADGTADGGGDGGGGKGSRGAGRGRAKSGRGDQPPAES